MRKKPTFEELANSTLVKPAVTPVSIPYISPYDSTAAVAEYRRMITEMQAQERIDAEYTAEAGAAAREFGVPQGFFENLARGVVQEGSQMHQEMMALHRNSAAAAARHSELQTDAILRDHATTRQEIVRNAAMQQRVAESLRGMPAQLAEAVLTAMRRSGAAASTPDAAAPPSPASFASPSPAADPAADPAAVAAASPTASPSPAADPASPAATVPGPSRITSQNPFSELPPVGHHEPGAHKPNTNPGAKEAIKQALEAEGMIKKSIDLAAKREKAQREAMRRVAQEQLDAESGPAIQTRLDEQAMDVANQATLLRTEGDYVTPASSSAAAADTGGERRGRKKDKDRDKDRDKDKSRKDERDRSPRVIQQSDL